MIPLSSVFSISKAISTEKIILTDILKNIKGNEGEVQEDGREIWKQIQIKETLAD